jgi:predicted negative regulator of RcsB-dependent stress response
MEMGTQILNSYPDSIYSDFVRLNEAKRSFENKESNEAIDLLKIVIEKNSGDQFNPLQVAAKTRLAKIYLNDADYDQVISLFESSDELTSTMYELKGDAEKKLGLSSEARMSYMLALQTNTNQASKALINMKISDLEGETFE